MMNGIQDRANSPGSGTRRMFSRAEGCSPRHNQAQAMEQVPMELPGCVSFVCDTTRIGGHEWSDSKQWP